MLDGFTRAGEEMFAFVLVEFRCLDPPWLLIRIRMHDNRRSFGRGIIPLKPAPVLELTQRINQAPEIKCKQVFHPAPMLPRYPLWSWDHPWGPKVYMCFDCWVVKVLFRQGMRDQCGTIGCRDSRASEPAC